MLKMLGDGGFALRAAGRSWSQNTKEKTLIVIVSITKLLDALAVVVLGSHAHARLPMGEIV